MLEMARRRAMFEEVTQGLDDTNALLLLRVRQLLRSRMSLRRDHDGAGGNLIAFGAPSQFTF
jgi:hypothetical protein